jgi:glycine/D-amino acid oxidase-like deaminating enzyme
VSLALWKLTSQEIQNQRRRFGDVIKLTGSHRSAGLDDDGTESLDIQRQGVAMRDAGLRVEMTENRGRVSLRVPEDAWCDPVERLACGWGEVTKNGGHIETTGTVRWRRDRDEWLIDTGEREIRSKVLFIASDAHLESQIPKLSGEIQTHRLQMLRASKPALGMDEPVYMRWGYDYGINHAGKLHLGGMRDQHRSSEVHGAWRGRCSVTENLQRDLEQLAFRLCKEECYIEWRWSAPVGYTPNGLPIAGEIEPGLWVAGGYNGHGNLISWILGREIAEELTGGRGRLLGMIGR